MMTLNDFDEIRPYTAAEMPVIFEELLADRQLNAIAKGLAPWLPRGLRNGLLRLMYHGVKTPQDFQLRFMKPLVKIIERRCIKSLSGRFDPSLRHDGHYVFLSNHRDIVLDSALLDILLNKEHFERTVEIGIGDNLLIYPWIKKLVRMNKAFTVKRGLTPHEMMRSSVLMSQYIHFAVNEKGESVWIAQREGRAKDSDDRTQVSVLKMFTLGAGDDVTAEDVKTPGGSVIKALRHLHIVPLTISYEYDPCDYLKAEEYQFKRDVQGWKKSKQDDLDNMKTGIMGQKGRVHYEAAPCIDDWLDTLDPQMSKKDILAIVAEHIDHEIHSRYRLYPGNWIAMDELDGTDHSDRYTAADKQVFETYLQQQLARVKVPQRDNDFLRERILTMYANPARNYLKAGSIN